MFHVHAAETEDSRTLHFTKRRKLLSRVIPRPTVKSKKRNKSENKEARVRQLRKQHARLHKRWCNKKYSPRLPAERCGLLPPGSQPHTDFDTRPPPSTPPVKTFPDRLEEAQTEAVGRPALTENLEPPMGPSWDPLVSLKGFSNFLDLGTWAGPPVEAALASVWNYSRIPFIILTCLIMMMSVHE